MLNNHYVLWKLEIQNCIKWILWNYFPPFFVKGYITIITIVGIAKNSNFVHIEMNI
jgi:hypothetical protein